MAEQSANVIIDVKPSLIAAWFHHIFTVPVVEIDDSRTEVASWGRSTVSAGPGKHRVSVYFRYRGQKTARLGESSAEFEVIDGESAHIEARLGPRNGSSFHVRTSPAS
ncbi:hypothetical protein [Streptomyces sp. NPDC047046]|uniref:hypothetical protein n=1 Tax=Streptomyces sp. NPDC047046 TaxID=3155378 RepID=UPI003405B101